MRLNLLKQEEIEIEIHGYHQYVIQSKDGFISPKKNTKKPLHIYFYIGVFFPTLLIFDTSLI